MDSMNLAPVTPRHTNNLGRAFAVAFVAIIVVATTVVLGTTLLGRGGGTGAAPGGAVAPVETPSSPPAPTPTPAPVNVTGTDTSSVSTQGTDVQVGDVEEMRGWTMLGASTMSDPRVSGTTTVGLNEDIHADQSADIWGTETLTGPDGAWVGSWAGLIDKGYATHRIAAVLKGTGAYEGLQYRYTLSGANASDGVHFNTTGVIEAIPLLVASAPVTARLAVHGTETCSGTAGGTATTVGGVEQLRDGTSLCEETMSDPRASGGSTRTSNADTYPDGSANWWGTGEITNSGGRWLGVWSGTMDAAQNVRIRGAWIGCGGYAGLQYRMNVVSPTTASYLTVTATIEPVE